MGEGRCLEPRGPHLHLLFLLLLPGLEGPLDLEANEVTPHTALLSCIEPQVPPSGYLLTYNTSAGQTQVPPLLPHWPAALPGFHSRRGCLCLCLSCWGSTSLSPDLPLLCPTDPAPRRGHFSPAPGPFSLHHLQSVALGHMGREPRAAHVHFLHHRYLGAATWG